MNWLRDNCYSPTPSSISNTNFHLIHNFNNIKYWTKNDFKEGKPPTVDHNDVLVSDSHLYTWLDQLNMYGLSLVKNVPTKLGSIRNIVERICYIRSTMYGDIFDVVSVPNAMNIAYTSVKLDIHQDLW